AEPDSNTLKPQTNAALTDQMFTDFPGTSEPALLAIKAPASEQARVNRALARLESLAAARGVAHPPFINGAGGENATTSGAPPLTGGGNTPASRAAVEPLRNDLVPSTLGKIPGVETAVTGLTAEDVDFTHQIKHGMPYVIGFVLVLAFLLLLF